MAVLILLVVSMPSQYSVRSALGTLFSAFRICLKPGFERFAAVSCVIDVRLLKGRFPSLEKRLRLPSFGRVEFRKNEYLINNFPQGFWN